MKEKRPHSAPPNHRFAFYHQNEALLFQFLLHECLRAHQILRKKPNPDLFLKIVGSQEKVTSNWYPSIGHLSKLSHYCSLLMTHFADTSATLCKSLSQTLDRAHLVAKKCYIVFDQNEKEYTQLYASIRKEIRLFMTLLFVKLYDFRDNASVLYFLLRHQEQFDALYRESIIRKTFKAFFPEGIKQAQVFLIEKFSKKGFNHLIPHIEQKLKQLDLSDSPKRSKKYGK